MMDTDVMRGEETKCIGLMNQIHFDSGLILLPGSHSKAIFIQDREIVRFSTFLSGEMLSAIQKNTILKASVTFDNVKPIKDALVDGYEYCELEGVNKSLFKVRILSNFLNASPDRVYSYFCGVLLHDEIHNLLCEPFDDVYIGGQKDLKQMMKWLLEIFSGKHIIDLDDSICERATSIGALTILQERENLLKTLA